MEPLYRDLTHQVLSDMVGHIYIGDGYGSRFDNLKKSAKSAREEIERQEHRRHGYAGYANIISKVGQPPGNFKESMKTSTSSVPAVLLEHYGLV